MQSQSTSDAPEADGPIQTRRGDFPAAVRPLDASAMMPLFECVYDAVVTLDPRDMRVMYANPAFVTLTGRSADEVVGCRLGKLLDGPLAPELGDLLRSLASEGLADAVLEGDLQSYEAAPGHVRLCRLVSGDAPLVGVILHKPESWTDGQPDRLGRLADDRRLDPLTGLADRSALLVRLNALLERGRTADRQFAVLFVDLDNFKEVNDSYGHLIGDRALAEVAHRLAGCVRQDDTVARFGGDEFVVLLEHVGHGAEVGPVVDRIHAALSEPLALAGGEVTLAVSIGVAHASGRHQTAEDLLAEADRAMYAAKRR